jgi:L-arabinokinase
MEETGIRQNGKAPVVYYTSAHGYGHGVRTCDILTAFHGRYPDVPVVLSTGLDPAFLHNRLPDGAVTCRRAVFDVGMVQLDSVQVDVPATLAAVENLYDDHDRKVAAEAEYLARIGAALVVCDIPAMPIESARRAGCPALAVGNFAWDWIYSDFRDRDARWQGLIAHFANAYEQTDLLLRLPFAEEMRAFPRREDVPLLASPGTARRHQVSELTGCPEDVPWVLLSFTSLDWDAAAVRQVAELTDYCFFTVLPLAFDAPNIYAVDRSTVCFKDVLASMDMVISKPGYGLLSECIVNRKPLVYVDRENFLEYPILEAAVQRYLRHQHISRADLYAGRLGPALRALPERPAAREHMAAGGDVIIADRIMEYCRRQVSC